MRGGLHSRAMVFHRIPLSLSECGKKTKLVNYSSSKAAKSLANLAVFCFLTWARSSDSVLIFSKLKILIDDCCRTSSYFRLSRVMPMSCRLLELQHWQHLLGTEAKLMQTSCCSVLTDSFKKRLRKDLNLCKDIYSTRFRSWILSDWNL